MGDFLSHLLYYLSLPSPPLNPIFIESLLHYKLDFKYLIFFGQYVSLFAPYCNCCYHTVIYKMSVESPPFLSGLNVTNGQWYHIYEGVTVKFQRLHYRELRLNPSLHMLPSSDWTLSTEVV